MTKLTKQAVLLLGLALASAFGANTGSVAGRVVDKRTGEPLIQASVVVEGTELGAATDANGRYLIINLPPGRYAVTASYTGYNDHRITDVLVIQDLTATVDFKLAPTVIDLGKTIDVTARKAEMVQRQAVSVERVITSEEFKRLPVTQLSELVGLQAGVTQATNRGWTHIRGGRYDDVAYLVDGVNAQDAVIGTLWSSPRPTTDALQSVVVITGGFDAEYGEAMSGIIKAVTKEGGSRNTGRVGVITDEVFPERTGYNYGYNRLTFSLGGPTPVWNRLRYFLSTEYYQTEDDRVMKYKVPSPRGEYAAEGKLTLQMPKSFLLTREGLKFTLDGYTSVYQWRPYSHGYKFWLEGLPGRRMNSYKSNFAINHLLSPTTVYEARFGIFHTGLLIAPRNYKAEQADTLGFWGLARRLGIWDRYFFRGEDWVFDWQRYADYEKTHPGSDTLASMQDAVLQLWRSYWLYISPDGKESIPVYHYRNNTNFASAYATTNNPYGVAGLFVGEGNDRSWHYRATDHLLGKLDVTRTVSKIHELKTGITVTRYTLFKYENSLPWDQSPFWDAYRYQPLVLAAYAQDRADFEDLVVRAGVRFDLLDSKANVRAFPESLGSKPVIADSMLPVAAKYRLSPRLGLSYPLTERVKFRFSYGHFFKTPTFEDIYAYADRTAAELRARAGIVGNADMGAEKTIAYEFGFDAQLSDVFEFDLTAFYKDVFDLSGVRYVNALPSPYSMYYNVEYARIQGFEATMTKQLDRYWSARVGYTFQIARGTASTATTQYGRSTPVQLDYYLDQDQRHSAHTDLTFSFPSDVRFIPARDFEASAVLSYGSGTPYTPQDLRGNQIGLTNSARIAGSYNIDTRLSKDCRLGGTTVTLNCDVINLLNSLMLISVYAATGKPDYTGRVITPFEFAPGVAFGDLYYHPGRDFDHDGYLTRAELYESYIAAYRDQTNTPANYGLPRKIRFGLSLSF
jgi:outer membrane receptor protein involved in Fe transport